MKKFKPLDKDRFEECKTCKWGPEISEGCLGCVPGNHELEFWIRGERRKENER